MQHFILLCITSLLFTQTATFHFNIYDNQNAKAYNTDSTTQLSDEISNSRYEINSSSSEVRSDSISPSTNETSSSTGDNNTVSSEISSSTNQIKSEAYTSSSRNSELSTKGLVNDSTSNHTDSFNESSSTANDKLLVGVNSTTVIVSPSGKNTNASTSSEKDDDTEEVVIVKPTQHGNDTTVASRLKTLYQKTLELISDTYTLSILLPVAAGIVFASTIILTIATCKCLKRRCIRNRFRRKVLPDSVKNLRPSDQARLLAETSDEEF